MEIDLIATVEKSTRPNAMEKSAQKTSHPVSGEYTHEFRDQLDRIMRKDDRRNESVTKQKDIAPPKTNTSDKAEAVSPIRKNEEPEVFAGEQGESVTATTIVATVAVPKSEVPEISAMIGLMSDTETVRFVDAGDVAKNPHDGVATSSQTKNTGITSDEKHVFPDMENFTTTAGSVAIHMTSTTHTSGNLAMSPDASYSSVHAFHLSETGDDPIVPARFDGKAPTTEAYVEASVKTSIDSSSQRIVSSATDIPTNTDESSFNASDATREAVIMSTKVQETGKSQAPSLTTDDGRTKADDALQLTGKVVAKEIASLNSETAMRDDAQMKNARHGSGQSHSDGDISTQEWLTEHMKHAGNNSGRENQDAGHAKEIASPTGMNIRSAASAPTTEIAMTSTVNTQGMEFVTQVADRIQINLRNGGGEIRIQLHPKELGRMDIRAEQGRDGLIARITVESSEVKNLLESNLASLRQVLEERGLRVDRINIVTQDDADTSVLADGGNRSGQTFAGQRHRNASGFDEDGEHPNAGSEISAEEPGDELATQVRPDSRFYTVA